jgi:large subunit ribosomal protein L22
MSPRKAQLVVEQIRGHSAAEALAILQFDPHAAARAVWKVVRSAMANAENNYALDPDDLFVVSATADKGPALPPKYRAKARGQAAIISRATTHITVVVDDEPGQLLRRQRLLQAQTQSGAGRRADRAAPPRRRAAPAPAAPAEPAEAAAQPAAPPAAPAEAEPAGTGTGVVTAATSQASATPAAPASSPGTTTEAPPPSSPAEGAPAAAPTADQAAKPSAGDETNETT